MKDRLDQLRADRDVMISGDADGWTLTLVSRRDGISHTYRGPDLDALIARAWAGTS